VAIDGFYSSSPALVTKTLEKAFALARGVGAQTIAVPALATGYGNLKFSEFAEGLAGALPAPSSKMRVVLSRAEHADEVFEALVGCGLSPSRSQA
jgi:O-acetyl-ADP-ribose deacetylase (regulator of RNase III)